VITGSLLCDEFAEEIDDAGLSSSPLHRRRDLSQTFGGPARGAGIARHRPSPRRDGHSARGIEQESGGV
jgi:hypothetical protein